MAKENSEQKHERWWRVVEKQKQSGLSKKEYCYQHNIVLSNSFITVVKSRKNPISIVGLSDLAKIIVF